MASSDNPLNDFTVIEEETPVENTEIKSQIKGVVKWFNQSGKYGVIKDEAGLEYFVYVTSARDKLYDGIEVIFDKLIDSSKNDRLSAVNVCYNKESTVNKDILYKINKIDMCFSYNNTLGIRKPNANEVQLVTNLKIKVNYEDLSTELEQLFSNIEPKKVSNKGVKIYTLDLESLVTTSYGGTFKSFLESLSFLMSSGDSFKDSSQMSSNIELWKYDSDRVVVYLKNKDSCIVHLIGLMKEITFKHKFSFIKNSVLVKDKCTIIAGTSVVNDWIIHH